MKLIMTLTLLLIFPLSFAGPGGGHSHDHSHGHSHVMMPNIAKDKLEGIGRHHIKRLVKVKKINSSWKKALLDKRTFVKGEWLITFTNKDGAKGKKLYIFLKRTGEFVAANFSGK